MTDGATARISINKVKIGMVLVEDVITANNQLLIPKQTAISDKHIFRMNLYQILSVVVEVIDGVNLDSEADLFKIPSRRPDDLSPQEELLYNSDSFRRFIQLYDRLEHLLVEQFAFLYDKGNFDTKALLSTTELLISSVRIKSELLTYMNSLRVHKLHTFAHSINVSVLCHLFGHWLKLSPMEIEHLTLAGLIHDIGKTRVDEDILTKEGRLSITEFDQVKLHSQEGYDLIKYLDLPDSIKDAVLLHHERSNGNGYPLGLERSQIPDFAKIVAIVDVYDAMTSSRTYHQKFSPFRVIQLFEQESFDSLDSKFLFIFLENMAHFYLGEEVLLNDGRKGRIVFIHNQSPSNPIIQSGDEMIDLMTQPNLTITEVL